jgi:hypothetical protein
MERDAVLVFTLATYAVAAFTVGICGWILWSRARRAGDGHHQVAEGS